MKKIKSATMLTLYSTAMIVASETAMFLFLVSDINGNLKNAGIKGGALLFINPIGLIVLISVSTFIAFFVGSLITDRMFNPIRIMTERVKAAAKMDFAKPLLIGTEDDEFREYAEAFNEMVKRLGGYIERQKRFISDASHEIATPITAIVGNADLLIRRRNEHPELLNKGLEIIKIEALRLDSLAENLLFLARNESGRQEYSFERSDISKLIAETVNETSEIYADYSFETNIEPKIYARIDAEAVRRAVTILLSNAMKYSAEQKRVSVSVVESNEKIKVKVKDSGIGIARDQLPYIFERFYRADDSRAGKTKGSGLGLSIAKEIIEAHGGEIKAESAYGEWTEVEFTLPVRFYHCGC